MFLADENFPIASVRLLRSVGLDIVAVVIAFLPFSA
jgi:hypothetical protein